MQGSTSLNKKGVFQYELPKGLLRLGMFIIGSSLVVLFLITWLLEYNETVAASITLTTKNLPLDIYSETEGELLVFVKENQLVAKGEVLAMVQKSGNYEDIQTLKSRMAKASSSLAISKQLSRSARTLELGGIQPALANLLKHYDRYQLFLRTDEHNVFEASKNEQIEQVKTRITLMQQKSSLISKDIALSQDKLQADQQLYKEEVIARRELDRSKQNHLVKKHKAIDNKVSINGLELEMKKLNHEIINLKNEFRTHSELLKQNIEDALFVLENEIRAWENQHLIKAGIEGICVYKEYLNDYQYTQKGDKVFTIIPEKPKDHFGWLKLPIKGSGKVKIGQVVNVHLDNFPTSEYGILKGRVEEISLLPSEGSYNVKVSFPEELVSTFNIPFAFQQLMAGRAEIITNKTTFLERLWYQAKARHLNR